MVESGELQKTGTMDKGARFWPSRCFDQGFGRLLDFFLCSHHALACMLLKLLRSIRFLLVAA